VTTEVVNEMPFEGVVTVKICGEGGVVPAWAAKLNVAGATVKEVEVPTLKATGIFTTFVLSFAAVTVIIPL
jgi:hypothetical protein